MTWAAEVVAAPFQSNYGAPSVMRSHKITLMRAALLLNALSVGISSATAIGFDNDDFLITSFSVGTIGVYDRDLTYKGLLEDNFAKIGAIEFDLEGNLVAASQHSDAGDAELRVYGGSGMRLASQGFTNPSMLAPSDLDQAPNGNYYIATQARVGEFSPSGTHIAWFMDDVPAHMSGVAVLPGGVVWGGGSPGQPYLNVYDPLTHDQIGSIALDHGQKGANHLHYSRTTNTVLAADWLGNAIVERDTSGNYLRRFTAPGFVTPSNVARGPGGHVFSLVPSSNSLYRWDADGNFLGFTSLGGSVSGPTKILWAGNSVPEPSSIGLVGICALAVLGRISDFQRILRDNRPFQRPTKRSFNRPVGAQVKFVVRSEYCRDESSIVWFNVHSSSGVAADCRARVCGDVCV